LCVGGRDDDIGYRRPPPPPRHPSLVEAADAKLTLRPLDFDCWLVGASAPLDDDDDDGRFLDRSLSAIRLWLLSGAGASADGKKYPDGDGGGDDMGRGGMNEW
jgi:hypothetical protein